MTTTPATEPTQPPVFGEWQPLPGIAPHTNTRTPARRSGKLTGILATAVAAAGLYTGAGGPLHLITLDDTGRHIALYTAAAAALVLLVTVLANKTRGIARPTAGQTAVTVGALVCTGVGVNTAWMFTATHLHITDEFTRVALCGTGEIVLVALGLAARDNLRRDQAPGTPGMLVWVITGFLAIPAYAEGSAQAQGFWQALVAGTWRAVFGPVGAAILWHFAMGLEIKAIDAAARSKGVLARLGRRLGQSILAAFGIGDTDTTTTELLRARARVRAANLTDRYRSLSQKRQGGMHGRWIKRRLRAALRTAGVAHDDAAKAALLADLAVSSHAPALSQLAHENPWGLSVMSVSATDAHTKQALTLTRNDAQQPALTNAQAPALERAQQDTETLTPDALTEDAHPASAQSALNHTRSTVVSAPIERAHTDAQAGAQPKPRKDSNRTERAQDTLSLTDRKALKEQQDTLTIALYAALNRRPEWTDIRDALTSAGLPEVSRPTAQRIRERVENAHPELTAERPALTAND